jgi:hypothetical protein
MAAMGRYEGNDESLLIAFDPLSSARAPPMTTAILSAGNDSKP